MGISAEDAKYDIDNSIKILSDIKPEYINLITDGDEVDSMSYNRLLKVRKLAQTYLRDGVECKKNDIDEKLTKNHDEIEKLKDDIRMENDIKAFLEGRYEDMRRYSSHGLRDIIQDIKRIDELKEQNRLTGDVILDFSNIEPVHVVDERINLLLTRIDLYKEKQYYDRILRSYTNNISISTDDDSLHEMRISKTERMIENIRNEAIQ